MPFRIAVPILAALSFLVSCLLVSPKKLFWFDEIASYLLASAPSIPRLLAAVADQTDTAPPLFHLVIWGWTRLIPPGELSLRLVSAVGVAVAIGVLWRTMARTYAFWPLALGLLNAFGLSTLLLLQNAEARFYGLFMALTAGALWAYDRLGRAERPSLKLLAANAGLHAALVLVHVYGFFYSGALLAALMVRDLAAGRRDFRVYASVLVGWLAFVPWIPNYLWQMQVGQPHSWMPVPTPEALLAAYSFTLPLPLILMGLLFVGALFAIARQRGAACAPEAPEPRAEIGLLIAAFALLAVPAAAWLFSRLAFPIFQDRYTLPALVGWAILFAALASRLLPARPFEGGRSLFATPARLALVGWLVGLLAAPVAYGALVRQQTPPHLMDEALGHTDLPVALESPHLYLPRFYYAEQRDRYHYILDWEAATSPRSISAAAPDYKILSGFKRHYPQLNVTQSEEFLAKHARFLLIDEDYRAWSELRLESNPVYKLTPLGATAGGRVYLVEKSKVQSPKSKVMEAR